MDNNQNKIQDDNPFAAAFAKAPDISDITGASAQQKEVPQVNYEDLFTEEENKMISDYAEKIDITDSATALNYGASSQKKISEFSDTALGKVQTKDFGETGTMIQNLLVQLKHIDDGEEKGGLFGLFRKGKMKLEEKKIQYQKAETSVNEIVNVLEDHQVILMKDISMFDNLYDVNLDYLKELTMYIAAGKKKLQHERTVTLEEMRKKAAESGRPEDAQAANDFAEQCTRFERRLYDLELTRAVAIQTAPQIRLLQNNDAMMSEKIQTIIMNTIPLWKSQMVLALGIEHSNQAMQAGRNVTEMTNELLKRNAETLHQSTVDINTEAERGIVDIEALTETNKKLIETLDEVTRIQEEGHAKRQAAEVELRRIENELKQKLVNAGAQNKQ